MSNFNRYPDLIIILDPKKSKQIINECRFLRIPMLGFVSPKADPYVYDYSIGMDLSSTKNSYFCFKFFQKLLLESSNNYIKSLTVANMVKYTKNIVQLNKEKIKKNKKKSLKRVLSFFNKKKNEETTIF